MIEVALPLPVASTPEQIQLVLTAARWAGIPNPYPVAEPAAALAHHFQMAFETSSYIPKATCTLILDIGAGSADLQGWSLLGTNPLRVREEYGGQTAWCGGSHVNISCRELVLQCVCNSQMLQIAISLENSPETGEFEILHTLWGRLLLARDVIELRAPSEEPVRYLDVSVPTMMELPCQNSSFLSEDSLFTFSGPLDRDRVADSDIVSEIVPVPIHILSFRRRPSASHQ